MKSKLLKISVIIAILLIAVVIAADFFVGSLVKAGVNRYGPQLTQTPVKLELAEISPLSGSGTLNLTAPNVSDSSTGAIAGVLFWQAASDTHDVTFSGTPSNIIQGTIYAPSAQLTTNGNNSPLYTLLVVNSLRLNGADNLNLNADTSGVTGGSPIKSALLVE